MYAVKMIIGDRQNSIFKPARTDLKESLSLSHATYDEYIDVFDTYAQAERFYLANLEEAEIC